MPLVVEELLPDELELSRGVARVGAFEEPWTSCLLELDEPGARGTGLPCRRSMEPDARGAAKVERTVAPTEVESLPARPAG